MRRTASVVAVFTAIALGVGPEVARAQGRPTRNPFEGKPDAVSNGVAMFRTRCAGCPGPDAHGYLGPHLPGFWGAGGTDERMFDIVRKGIPGTEMIAADPARVLDRDIWQV